MAGDRLEITLVRVDSRLLHGQVIEVWLPRLRVDHILVANDRVAADELMQEAMQLAVPEGIELVVSPVEGIVKRLNRSEGGRIPPCGLGRPGAALPPLADGVVDGAGNSARGLLLFDKVSDAARAYQDGLHFSRLNVGNLHYSPGSVAVSPSINVTRDDVEALVKLAHRGVKVDFRSLPEMKTPTLAEVLARL